MTRRIILHKSVGVVSEEPQGHSAVETVMCSNCFDQQSGNLVISEFPALAGGIQTEYDLESEEDFSYASRLTGIVLTLEDFQGEASFPIVCSECNDTVGIVQSITSEE